MARPTELKRSVLAQAIKDLRENLGDTQQQFAHRLGVSVVTVAKYETNHQPAGPMLERMIAVAEDAGLTHHATVVRFLLKTSLEPQDSKGRRNQMLVAALFVFLQNPDDARYRRLETILKRELTPLRKADEAVYGPLSHSGASSFTDQIKTAKTDPASPRVRRQKRAHGDDQP